MFLSPIHFFIFYDLLVSAGYQSVQPFVNQHSQQQSGSAEGPLIQHGQGLSGPTQEQVIDEDVAITSGTPEKRTGSSLEPDFTKRTAVSIVQVGRGGRGRGRGRGRGGRIAASTAQAVAGDDAASSSPPSSGATSSFSPASPTSSLPFPESPQQEPSLTDQQILAQDREIAIHNRVMESQSYQNAEDQHRDSLAVSTRRQYDRNRLHYTVRET